MTNVHGQTEYIIHRPAAWDRLALTPEWLALAARADAVCWGSLAQRERASRETVQDFLGATRAGCLRVFDVNLRQQFATAEAVRASLEQATVVKLNDGEMPRLCELDGLAATPLPPAGSQGFDSAREAAFTRDARGILSAHADLELVAITLGGAGSLLVSRTEAHRHRGVPIQVADTVGAGDAFTAALVTHRLAGASLAVQSEAANRWGAWVASQPGAMPPLAPGTRAAIEQEIARSAEKSAERSPQ